LYQTLLRDSSFFALLLRFDEDLAAEVRQAGCGMCGGALHSARYPRKPRGGPAMLGAEHRRRREPLKQLLEFLLGHPALADDGPHR
jgi:hypothetical protein